MSNNVRKALSAYQKNTVDVAIAAATPHQLIVMLFDGAMAAISQAKINLENGDVRNKGLMVGKAVSIIEEGLKGALDKTVGGELTQSLDDLYEYMLYKLLQANFYNRVTDLEEVYGLLVGLRESWVSIGAKQELSNSESQPAILSSKV
ncbi:flagellar export chaperone FliS [Chitinibacter sp. SCUT-21]|uniref:flagellar export chaperone FliS n=1 Tax=Chitinibacter sp. SCUT-21 TaxID=2970891 RepID=UPI0035A5E133